MALGGEKNTVYTFIFHVKRFSREKVKHKKKGYKMHMLLWQAIMLLVGAIMSLLGRILRRDKVAMLGDVLAFLGASAIVYSVLAVVL